MKNWYQIMLNIPIEKLDADQPLPTPVRALIDTFSIAWKNAGSPHDVALFMGEYHGLTQQRFFLPPSSFGYLSAVLKEFGATLIEEPEPHRLLHKIAGSDAAFDSWCPWVHRESIEYPPLGSTTFRFSSNPEQSIEDDDDDSDEEVFADVSGDEIDFAMSLMRSGRFADALPIFVRATRFEPHYYGNWYMAGQCYRFSNNYPKAIEYLKEAARLDPFEKQVFLALGIAFQLYGQLENAVGALLKAIEIDSNFDLAYNSLALTQMKKGDFELALHNYDGALKAMTRRLVATFRNVPGRGITKHHDSPHALWAEYAIFGAMFIAGSDPTIAKLAWPTGEFAISEEKNENFEGFFWRDQTDQSGAKTRLFLPNYFNTFEVRLRDNSDYSTLVRAKGTALEALGRVAEAQQHYQESEYFRLNTEI